MGRLISDLLALSRAGRASLNISPIEMKGLVWAAFTELAAPNQRSCIHFQLSDIPDAPADPSLIRQVWRNLLPNAIKFSSRQPEAAITVADSVQGQECVYSVRDNSAGLDMKYSGKLFAVFQRLHSTSEFEGTSVGLAIVKRIVDRHGRRVWGESPTGQGAVF